MDPLVHEVIDVSEAQFTQDETTGKMSARVKLISAGKAQGKNRRYSSDSIRKAAKEGIYDGLRMFVNHSDRPPTRRGIGELVSAVESTDYDPKTDSVMGNIEFFNRDFFEYAQRAKKYMGVSADHRIAVNHVREGAVMVEDVREIVGARSVDWVVYPAAGGEIISFAQESEGADDVDWTEITPELLKEHNPTAYAAILATKESAGPDDEPDEPEGDPKKKTKKDVTESVTMTRVDIEKLVQEQVTSIQTAAEEKRQKQTEAGKKVRDFIAKSGLPPRTGSRIINQFADALEYVEANVQESVDAAKAELKEAGAGPRIRDMGPSGGSAQEGEEQPTVIRAREGVEEYFHMGKKKEEKKATKTTATSGEES